MTLSEPFIVNRAVQTAEYTFSHYQGIERCSNSKAKPLLRREPSLGYESGGGRW